jgi:hypothetical protein
VKQDEINDIMSKYNNLKNEIGKYGREYAISTGQKHPFESDKSSWRGDKQYSIVLYDYDVDYEPYMMLEWCEEEYSCGSTDTNEYTLKIPYKIFDHTDDFERKKELDRKIEITETISAKESLLKTMNINKSSVSTKMNKLSSDFRTYKSTIKDMFVTTPR